MIDTFKGKHAALADSLDYQYMRTVFRLEDRLEDGFVFLSDRFIRTLVGPATRIKTKRWLRPSPVCQWSPTGPCLPRGKPANFPTAIKI